MEEATSVGLEAQAVEQEEGGPAKRPRLEEGAGDGAVVMTDLMDVEEPQGNGTATVTISTQAEIEAQAQEAIGAAAAVVKGHEARGGEQCVHCKTNLSPRWMTPTGGPGLLCMNCGDRFYKGRLTEDFGQTAQIGQVVLEEPAAVGTSGQGMISISFQTPLSRKGKVVGKEAKAAEKQALKEAKKAEKEALKEAKRAEKEASRRGFKKLGGFFGEKEETVELPQALLALQKRRSVLDKKQKFEHRVMDEIVTQKTEQGKEIARIHACIKQTEDGLNELAALEAKYKPETDKLFELKAPALEALKSLFASLGEPRPAQLPSTLEEWANQVHAKVAAKLRELGKSEALALPPQWEEPLGVPASSATPEVPAATQAVAQPTQTTTDATQPAQAVISPKSPSRVLTATGAPPELPAADSATPLGPPGVPAADALAAPTIPPPTDTISPPLGVPIAAPLVAPMTSPHSVPETVPTAAPPTAALPIAVLPPEEATAVLAPSGTPAVSPPTSPPRAPAVTLPGHDMPSTATAQVDSHPTSPPKAPTSPSRGPTSPPRVPTSPPRVPTSPPRVPTSPPRVPTSPPGVPTSPPRVPTSPPRVPTSPTEAPVVPTVLLGAPTSPPRAPTSPSRVPTPPLELPVSPPRAPMSPLKVPTSPPLAPTSPPKVPRSPPRAPPATHPLVPTEQGAPPTQAPTSPAKQSLATPTSAPRMPTSPPRAPSFPPKMPTSPPKQAAPAPGVPTSPPKQGLPPMGELRLPPRVPSSEATPMESEKGQLEALESLLNDEAVPMEGLLEEGVLVEGEHLLPVGQTDKAVPETDQPTVTNQEQVSNAEGESVPSSQQPQEDTEPRDQRAGQAIKGAPLSKAIEQELIIEQPAPEEASKEEQNPQEVMKAQEDDLGRVEVEETANEGNVAVTQEATRPEEDEGLIVPVEMEEDEPKPAEEDANEPFEVKAQRAKQTWDAYYEHHKKIQEIKESLRPAVLQLIKKGLLPRRPKGALLPGHMFRKQPVPKSPMSLLGGAKAESGYSVPLQYANASS